MGSGHKVRIEVVDILEGGVCPHGCRVGDSWTVDSGTVPEGFCGSAYHTLFPYLTGLRFGASFPWEEAEREASIACPDPQNPVVFRMRVVD